jgi:hypothetical protein
MLMRPRKRARPKVIRRNFNAAGFLAGAACLVAGLLVPFSVHLVGELYLGEILLALLMPFLMVMRGREMFKPTMRPMLLLIGLWLLGEILSDIYRQSAMANWLRGDSNIIFFVLDLLALVALLGKSDFRKMLFIVALGIGELAYSKLNPDAWGRLSWKFGYAPAIVYLTLLAACYFYKRRNYAVTVLLILAFAAVNVVMNFRSMVLFMLIVIAMTVPVIPERVGRLQLLPPQGTTARLLVTAALALGAGGVAFGVVEFATRSGILGQEEQAKNEKQSQSAGGLILGARPEILVCSRAILDSPIVGHGSWPHESRYTEMLADIQAKFGVQTDPDSSAETKEGVIPMHSSILGAWVSAGILGLFFWIYIIPLVVKALVRVAVLRPPLAPFFAYVLLRFFWDIFFSPFAGNHRILAAFDLVIMIDLLEVQIPALATRYSDRFGRVARKPLVWRPSIRF